MPCPRANEPDRTRLEQVKFRGHLDCRFIGACRRREEIEITVPRSYLEARRDTGVVLKLRGFELARVVLPPGYVDGFLTAFDSASAPNVAMLGDRAAD